MASFIMQVLGCDVCSINTVKGTKSSAEEIAELYQGLRQSNLSDFNVMLTGYVPSAEAVRAVGTIGRDRKLDAAAKPGSFFWVLDPVMGDNGQLYIPEEEVVEYKTVLREADLVLPNQFEAEVLTDMPITDLESVRAAVRVLHQTYRVPHVVLTSLRLATDNDTGPSWPSTRSTHGGSDAKEKEKEKEWLTIIGSTATSDYEPRLFRIDVPAFPLFFSGTGDLFAALMVVRLVECVRAASTAECRLERRPSWRSGDEVRADGLPLALACQKVLASMQAVLAKTTERCRASMADYDRRAKEEEEEAEQEARKKKRHLALMNASEVVVPCHVKDLIEPPDVERFTPRAF